MEQVVEVQCPFCGEGTALFLTGIKSSGNHREEGDCQTCCRPFHVEVTVVDGQLLHIAVKKEW